jgi:murein DD-endopeptidase MepM/ murein hydrolase activator NlpD
MRRGVWLLVLGALAAAFSAASARADGTTTTGTSTGATTTAPTPSYAPLTASYLSANCVGAGDAAIAEPGVRVLALGTPASSRGPSAYTTKVPAVAFGSSAASGSTCRSAHVSLQSVSLFGGYVTASSVEATHGSGTVSGLAIGGSPAGLGPGDTTLLGTWGQLTLGKTVGRLTAPLVVTLFTRHWLLPAGTTILVGFAASAEAVAHKSAGTHHTSTSAQPTGTTTAGSSQKQPQAGHAAKGHKHRKLPQPLTVTPPLGFRPSHYVFPVDGGASYVDTYGANRNDISDGWHHGDDLFAPLGTPIVAVANGTLSLVGWESLGGWRLWLTDGAGNSFYYAHLSGYSRWILHHPHVRAGQVIGFLGRTGDAFTTTPHLHFEIHPHQLIQLGYDGAVDPTAYLHKWRTVTVPADEMPRPARLKAPVGTPSEEASVVWHQLLVARHLVPATGSASPAAAVHLPFPHPPSYEASGATPLAVMGLRPTAAHVSEPTDLTPWLGGGLSGAFVIVAASTGAFILRRRRRTSDEPVSPPATEPSS